MRYPLNTITLNTPLGSMQAIADEQSIVLLEFTDNPRLNQKITTLLQMMRATVVNQQNPILDFLTTELMAYFHGSLKTFNTPITLHGSLFQQHVWKHLQTIGYNATQSYSQLAASIRVPSGCRAVAQANASNRLAIIVPCHRIITKNGSIGGYSGGIHRKEWLLNHEKKWCSI